MKKIGIDARLIGQTGVGRYITNLLRYLPEDNNYIFYIYTLAVNLQKIPKKSNFVLREADYRWHTFAEQTAFLKLLYQDNLDLMHFTYFSYPLFYKRKFMITLHDLIPYFYKTGKATSGNQFIYKIKHFFYKLLLKNAVKNARLIIAPSETIKSEIVKNFHPMSPDKIKVIYEGVAEELMNGSENMMLKKQFLFPFFVYIGNFYPHKNMENLVRAFAKIANDVKLILIGPADFFSGRLHQLINQLKQKERILFFKNPTDADLKFFYQHAQALIHPSLSEGFGLPLIEAAYFDCPIIASDIPIFNEILNGQFIKFNPHEVEDIKNKIEQQINQPKKFDYQNFLQKFSFKKMTEKTFEVYKKILNFQSI